VEGFAGYKVGMTHAFIVDYRKRSTTAGQEVAVPVTVVETPPLRIVGARLYQSSPYGSRVVAEVWGGERAEELDRTLPPRPAASGPEARQRFESATGDEVRLIAHTQPGLLQGVPSKTPSLFELRVAGEKADDRRRFALAQIGQELRVDQFAKEGEFLDVLGVTKGKGFQGHIKRWGVKLQPRKNSKHRRMIGTLGPHNPSFVTFRIPQSGQVGFHRRTQLNMRILKIVKDPRSEPISPLGGWPHYGEVRSSCVVLHGSLPGPAKRLLRFRTPIRSHVGSVEKVDLRYLSTASKQGG
jgi:large subunit ribosomal protein L3